MCSTKYTVASKCKKHIRAAFYLFISFQLGSKLALQMGDFEISSKHHSLINYGKKIHLSRWVSFLNIAIRCLFPILSSCLMKYGEIKSNYFLLSMFSMLLRISCYLVHRLQRFTALPWSMHLEESCRHSSSYKRIFDYLRSVDGRIYGNWYPPYTTCTREVWPIGK